MYTHLKVFTGVVTGSLGGRDDGYPEEQYVVFENERDMLEDPVRKDQHVYSLCQITKDDLKILKDKLNRKRLYEGKKRMAIQKKSKEMLERKQYERLKAKYG